MQENPDYKLPIEVTPSSTGLHQKERQEICPSQGDEYGTREDDKADYTLPAKGKCHNGLKLAHD